MIYLSLLQSEEERRPHTFTVNVKKLLKWVTTVIVLVGRKWMMTDPFYQATLRTVQFKYEAHHHLTK